LTTLSLIGHLLTGLLQITVGVWGLYESGRWLTYIVMVWWNPESVHALTKRDLKRIQRRYEKAAGVSPNTFAIELKIINKETEEELKPG